MKIARFYYQRVYVFFGFFGIALAVYLLTWLVVSVLRVVG
jgi:hypothetical protein